MKANIEVRNKIRITGVRYWEVANKIGISPSTFTVWMRTEMDSEKMQRVMEALEELEEKMEVK